MYPVTLFRPVLLWMVEFHEAIAVGDLLCSYLLMTGRKITVSGFSP